LVLAGALFALVVFAPSQKNLAAGEIKNGNQNELIIYGILTRALLYADDGDRHHLFNVDGGVENTRIGFIASGKLNADITVKGHLELDMAIAEAAGDVNLNGTESIDRDWDPRIEDIIVSHRRYGSLSLGKGDTASTDRVATDLSGSDLAVGNNPADMAGGIHFYNKTTGARTVTMGDVIDKVDGIDKASRIRYDLPEVGGLNMAVSMTGGGATDIGAGYAREFGEFEFEAGAYYANVSGTSTTDSDLWGGAGSLKHSSGLSLTVAGAVKGQKATGRDEPNYLWGKIGYSASLFKIGETHFGLSHGQYNDFSQNGDEATSYGIGIVQDIEVIGSNLWLLVRNHQLDQAGNNSFDDIFVVSTGVVLNF